MELGGHLYFNKTESMFVANDSSKRGGMKHDENNNIDLKINESFIKNGEDNFFPFDIEETVKRSMIQRRALETITTLINGTMIFQNPDGSAVDANRQIELTNLYRSIGIDKNNFLSPVSSFNYLQGGCFVTNQFESNGREFRLSRVMPRIYKTGRLSAPEWGKFNYTNPKHFFHRNWGYKYNKNRRNAKVRVSKDTLSWLEWNKDPKKNFDEACYIPEYNLDLPLSNSVNRLQSSLIRGFDALSEHYPLPPWFSGTVYNYQRSEFFLSCFDVDDIENGLHASGILKVYHKDYLDPATSKAKNTFDKHKKQIEDKFRGSKNSGSVAIVPVGLSPDGKIEAGNDYMEFEAIENNNVKDRHDTFDSRIIGKVLGANSIVMPELLGIRDEKSTLSESGSKLLNAAKLLMHFVVKPQKELIEIYLNEKINTLLGIQEQVVIIPNASAFANLAPEVMKHYLHPDQFYDMVQDFGIKKPTLDQIESGLIPAYSPNQSGKKITIE